MKKITIRSLEDLEKFAKTFAGSLRGGEVIGLVGPLGAGKTTFTQALARALGVRSAVRSPTFTLMQIHEIGRGKLKSLVHIDAYRLSGVKDFEAIGAFDYVGKPETVAVIEWADRVRKALPEETRWITIVSKNEERIFTITE